MGPKLGYEKDNVERENESTANVIYNVHDNKQLYHKKNCTKDVEKRTVTKYETGSQAQSALRSSTSRATTHHSPHSKASSSRSTHKSHTGHRSANHTGSPAGKSCSRRSSSRAKSKVEVSAKCYDVRRGRKRESCGKGPRWQHGKFVRDECGSGIIAKRFDFRPSRKIWCKTPLTMYQATIGEMARKILCREKVVPRDVKPGPPCNIEEYILPLCRGYYRKYDCLRPCEEEYTFYEGGKKHYRDRVERYWEPCYSKDQKYKLDINEYAPHNAFLAEKMRRFYTKGGELDPPCW